MSAKRILTVGFQLASDDAEYESFQSNISLLDWDIVLFKPVISGFASYGEYYQGKPSLDDDASFRLKECCEHWRREIKEALETGKTIIVFLSALEEVFVDTGQRKYSGTGRNQHTTRIVSGYNNYKSIPTDLSPVPAAGNSMKLSTRGAEVLAAYWREFENVSRYEVILSNPEVPAAIQTRTGEKTVGAIYASKTSAGKLLFVPDVDFESEEFFTNSVKRTWSPAGTKFSKRMISTVVALDKALRDDSEVTPEPIWATDSRYVLGVEDALRVQLLAAEIKVEQAQKEKEKYSEELKLAGAYRALLFEKGKALENVVIAALRLLGFRATPFKDTDSEFDVVFESAEGRLIGEAEGKDNKAVNIDKLRQLSMNIHEDLQREGIDVPAKPVLFGNGFRLQPVNERANPFSEKCHSASKTSSTALVFTPDLFWPVQYLISNSDSEYALACRQAMLDSVGRVVFPPPPLLTTQDILEIEEEK